MSTSSFASATQSRRTEFSTGLGEAVQKDIQYSREPQTPYIQVFSLHILALDQSSALVPKSLLPGAVPSACWVRMNVAKAPTRASSCCIMQAESPLQLSSRAIPTDATEVSVQFLSLLEALRWFLSAYPSMEGAKRLYIPSWGRGGGTLPPEAQPLRRSSGTSVWFSGGSQEIETPPSYFTNSLGWGLSSPPLLYFIPTSSLASMDAFSPTV